MSPGLRRTAHRCRVRILDAHRYDCQVPTTKTGSTPVVLFVGGGTGGHIYPNVAIAEQLCARIPELTAHFWVSDRPGDAKIMQRLPYDWSFGSVGPLPPLKKPWRALSFLKGWNATKSKFRGFLQKHQVVAIVTTGGFVSGPPMVVAAEQGLVRAMVNLDGVPGKANRRLLRYAQACFTVYPHPSLDQAQRIGLPLRQQSRIPAPAFECRQRMGLDPERKTLMVTGATHGATSIIETMMMLVQEAQIQEALRDWQVLHQCGKYDVAKLQAAYDAAGVKAKAVDFIQEMGTAWGASDLVVSRSGAGSVAEAWGNAVPTIFMPNPYHADGHQRDNCAPMLAANAALEVVDHKEAKANVPGLQAALMQLLVDQDARDRMRQACEASSPGDGAEQVAQWVQESLQAAK